MYIPLRNLIYLLYLVAILQVLALYISIILIVAPHTLTLAMVLYPDAFWKARSEIDAVVGQDRLPDFFDKESSPYTCAIVKEVLRWIPVTPLGL